MTFCASLLILYMIMFQYLAPNSRIIVSTTASSHATLPGCLYVLGMYFSAFLPVCDIWPTSKNLMFHYIIVLIFIVASFHGAIILATRHMLPHIEWRDRFSYSINFTVQPATNESISNESEQIHITRNQYNDRASGGSPPPYTKYVSTNLALARFVLASCYRNTQDVVGCCVTQALEIRNIFIAAMYNYTFIISGISDPLSLTRLLPYLCTARNILLVSPHCPNHHRSPGHPIWNIVLRLRSWSGHLEVLVQCWSSHWLSGGYR